MARTTKGYGIKDGARRSHVDIGDGEWAEIYYEGMSGLDAARKGRQIRKFVSATKQPDITAFVSTSANIYFNLTTTRSRVMVTSLVYGCHSTSDNLQVAVGYTTAANGAGTFTALTPDLGFHVAAAHAREEQVWQDLVPPLPVRYTADSARSVTLRVTANDTSAEVNMGWYGYYEAE